MIFKKIIAGILLGTVVTSSTAVFAETEPKSPYSTEYRVLEQVAGYASELYIDETVMPDDIIKAGISKMLEENPEELVPFMKNMIGALDPYSEFFTIEEYMGYTNEINRAFYGIGVIIPKNGDYIEVVGFTKDSPSELSGIKLGDKIQKVDGLDMRGKNINEVRTAIMGELGTEVLITVLRDEASLDFSIKRSMVNQATVEYIKLDDNTAYISISDMAADTASEFSEALAEIDRWGIKNIILDLRDNGGGYLDSVIEIAKMIVPQGLIVKTVYRNPLENYDYVSNLKNAKYKFNILVNEYTASAAEILASALQESGVGTVIGNITYGKAVIQKAYHLINGTVLKLTVGRYITRAGNEINEVGIRPDEKILNVTNPIDTKKYSQFDYKTKLSLGAKGEGVKAAKERLYLLGLYSGTLDDNFDDLLEKAVIDFQAKSELYPYGVLDITTQVKLENTFAKLEVLEDLQFNRAYELFGGKITEE